MFSFVLSGYALPLNFIFDYIIAHSLGERLKQRTRKTNYLFLRFWTFSTVLKFLHIWKVTENCDFKQNTSRL